MEGEMETAPKLSNGTSLNDLQWQEASRGLSATAELLVHLDFKGTPLLDVENLSG